MYDIKYYSNIPCPDGHTVDVEIFTISPMTREELIEKVSELTNTIKEQEEEIRTYKNELVTLTHELSDTKLKLADAEDRLEACRIVLRRWNERCCYD